MTEKIIAAVYGIALASTPFSAKQINIGWAKTPLGSAGEIMHPENSLFFTDNRVLVVAIPLPGVDWSVGNASISSAYALIGVNKLKEKGDEMIKTMTPEQILESNKKNFEIPYNSIMEIKAKSWLFGRFVSFKLINGKKYKYMLSRKEQFEILKKILLQLLPNKIK